MKDLIRKYRKTFSIFSLLILSYLIISLYIAIKYNFDYLVKEFVINKLEYNIDFSNIKPSLSNLKISDFILKDEDDTIILEAPFVYIKFNLRDALKGYLISNIIIENPNVYLEIYNYSNTNITEALNIDFSVESDLPLKEISILDGNLYYKDSSYSNLIKKEFIKLNGGLTLIQNKLDLYFEAWGKEDPKEKLGFYMKDTDSGMDIRIVGTNINLSDELMQYAYDDEGMLEYKGGIANIDLTIYSEGLKGYTFVQGTSLSYEGLKKSIDNINLEAYYDKRNIDLLAKGNLEDNPIDFTLTKRGNHIDLNFKSKSLDFSYLLENLLILPENEYLEKVEGLISSIDISLLVDFVIIDEIEETKLSLASYLEVDYIKYNNSIIEDFSGEFIFNIDEKLLSFNQVDFKGSFYEFEPLPIKSRVNLSGDYNFQKLNISYELYNEQSFFSQKLLKGNLSHDLKTQILIANNDSPDFNLDLLLNMDEGHLLLDLKLKEDIRIKNNLNLSSKIETDLKIDYNYKTRELNKSKGSIILENSEHYDYLELVIDEFDNELIIEKFLFEKNNSKINLKGKVDLKNLIYEAKIKDFLFESRDFYDLEEKLDFKLAGDLNIYGEEKDFNLVYDLDSEYANYLGKIERTKISGELSYINESLNGFGEGYIGLFEYSMLNFKDLYLKFNIKNNKINIRHLKNKLLYLSGTYNLKNNKIDMFYSIKDFNTKRFDFDFETIYGEIGNLYGEIKGKLNEIELSLNFEDSTLHIDDIDAALIEGNISFKEQKLFLHNLKFKNNTINGVIDLKEEKLDLRLNILEDDLNRYYRDSNFRYRVIGQGNLWGNFDNLRAVSSISINNIYYRGEQIPEFFAKFSYSGGNLFNFFNSGKLSLTSLTLLGDENEKWMEVLGYFDMEKRKFFLELANQDIYLDNAEYLFENVDLEGVINLDFKVEGTLGREIIYSFNLNSDGFKYNEVSIDKVEARIHGNEKKVHIDYLNMYYDKNKLISQGELDIESLNYNFIVQANELDLDVVNIFFFNRDLNIGGLLDINLLISNEKTEGSLKLKDLSANFLEDTIKLENINSSISLLNNEITILNFNGTINNGFITLDGTYTLPDFNDENFQNLEVLFDNYNFNLTIDEMDYIYNKSVILNLSSDINFQNRNLMGDIFINKGKLLKLPENNQEKENFIKEEKEASIFDKFYAKLNISTRDSLLISIDELSFIEEIELLINGRGILELRDGKKYFTGSLFTEKGALIFNNNIFEVTSGVVVFDDTSKEINELNPSISIRSRTRVGTEDIYININGYYEDLEFRLSSASGLSEGDITSLLLFKTTMDDNTVMLSVGEVVKDMLDKQLSEQLFTPLSRELEQILNVSRVRISSGMLATKDDELRVNNDLISGATIEIQNPLYEDRVFWNIKTQFSEEKSGEIESYDLWLDYRISRTLAWKLGIERLDNTLIDRDENNLHLGIDFRFERDTLFWKR